MLLNDPARSTTQLVQPLLTATTLSMLLGPLLIRHNERIADRILGRDRRGPLDVAIETAATRELARREHVIICGFGRVGQNLARVLEQRGFEYIALDLDTLRVRDARQAGDPVVYGDATHPEVLRALGLDRASVVVITFADAEIAIRIVHGVAPLRADVPVLVRRTTTAARAAAGRRRDRRSCRRSSRPASRSSRTCCCTAGRAHRRRSRRRPSDIRSDRYALLRSVFRRRDARDRSTPTTPACASTCARSTLPPTAHAVGRSISDLGLERGAVVVTAIRREGIVGRDPDPDDAPARGRRRSCCSAPQRTSSMGSPACSWVERQGGSVAA